MRNPQYALPSLLGMAALAAISCVFTDDTFEFIKTNEEVQEEQVEVEGRR